MPPAGVWSPATRFAVRLPSLQPEEYMATDQSTNPSSSSSGDVPSFSVKSIRDRLGDHPEFSGHEEVAVCHDKASGLRSVVAIHDTTIGPSLGGCRRWSYDSEADAITDVLRLSKAMSYKHAIAGTKYGGGKGVIFGDAATHPTEASMRAFGRFVNSLQGKYITAEDVGISVNDLIHVAAETTHVVGLPMDRGGSGDPSPMTAYGVFCGIVASLNWSRERSENDLFDCDVLKGVKVAVQGIGHVGYDLCRQLHEAGVNLVVSDVSEDRMQRACEDFDAVACPGDEILQTEADVFAPCALGGILNDQSIGSLGARIVAGAANNQLDTPQDGLRLHQRGILYAPDFVINSGGIINISHEDPVYDVEAARAQTRKIAQTVWQIFARSRTADAPPSEVADALGRQLLAAAK